MTPINFAQLVKGSALSLNGQTIIVESIEHLPRDGILGERTMIVASGRKLLQWVGTKIIQEEYLPGEWRYCYDQALPPPK